MKHIYNLPYIPLTESILESEAVLHTYLFPRTNFGLKSYVKFTPCRIKMAALKTSLRSIYPSGMETKISFPAH